MRTITTQTSVRMIVFFILIVLSNTSYGKNKLTITVSEKETGDLIPFALVSVNDKANSKPFGITDIGGTFSTTELEIGQRITISSLGYTPVEVVIPKNKLKVSVELKKGIELKELTVTAAYVPLIGCGVRCVGVDISNCFGCCHTTKTVTDPIDQRVKSEIISMKIYPNPGRGSVRISSGLENYIIEVFDCTGKLVMNFRNGNDEQLIDLQELNAGIYFCRITKDSIIQTSRLVIN